MQEAITTALIAAGSALLTILLTPRLQHAFWKHQKKAELRLSVINDFNRLTSEFLTGHINATRAGTAFKPSDEWFTSFRVVESNVRGLFSEEASKTFKAVEVLIGPGTPAGGLGASGKYMVQDFLERQDKVLKQLYRDVGLR